MMEISIISSMAAYHISGSYFKIIEFLPCEFVLLRTGHLPIHTVFVIRNSTRKCDLKILFGS
jgi:hypothetical protein